MMFHTVKAEPLHFKKRFSSKLFQVTVLMMFRRSTVSTSKPSGDGHAVNSAILPIANNLNAPSISMRLGNNILMMNEKGTWSLESSDLDNASELIEKLMEEKENLAISLSQSVDQIEKLTTEIYEVNEIKAVVLEMVRLQLISSQLFDFNDLLMLIFS